MIDYEFHKQQERARLDEKRLEEFKILDRAALSSGWMQRQIKAEQFQEDDEFLKQYHAQRMQEFKSNMQQKKFGSLIELDTNNFVMNVEREGEECNIIVHLYEPEILACRMLNHMLPTLASLYQHDKFCIMSVNEADPDFDHIGLPCILVYKQGKLTHTFTRLNDDIPGWTTGGRVSIQDLEEYFQIQEVLTERTNDPAEVSEDDFDDDFFE